MKEGFHNQVPFKLTQCEGKGFSLVHGGDHLSNHSRLGFVFQLFEITILHQGHFFTLLRFSCYEYDHIVNLENSLCGQPTN